MSVLDDQPVPAPLFISGRLMAALKIDGAGTLHLLAGTRTGEGRIPYTWTIEDADGTELESGDDLSSGVGDPVNYPRTMGTLIAFLGAAAERDGDDGDPALFNPAVTEWARQNSDELTMAGLEMDEGFSA